MNTKKPVALSAMAVAVMTASISANASSLMISEYVEGGGFTKAIELFNSGPSSVALDNYSLELYANGSSSPTTLNLAGELEPKTTYVIVHPDSGIKKSNLQNASVINFNGDDDIVLKDSSGNIVDILGKIGKKIKFGKDKTLARKPGYSASPTFDLSEWETFPKDYVDGLGKAPGGSVTPPDDDFAGCDSEDTSRISAIQGNDDDFAGQQYKTPPTLNQKHLVKGVVTAVYGDTFFIQQTPSTEDKPGASLGLEIVGANTMPSVGDTVAVEGIVKDPYGMTQLTEVKESIAKCQADPVDINTLIVKAPMPQDADLEEYEGMLVKLLPKSGDDGFYVSNTYNLNRYGQMVVASGQPLYKPTNKYPAGSAEARNEQGYNGANRVTIDDRNDSQNPGVISYLPELSYDKYVRTGSHINDVTGILDFSYGDFRISPIQEVVVDNNTATDRRGSPEKPADGAVRVASFNVLNYFNGMDGSWKKSDLGGARGANNQFEFDRQHSKIVTAIVRMDADVIGIMEVENDGWDDEVSAIDDLVDGLNESPDKAPGATYDYVRSSQKYIGDDVIKISLIYDAASMTPVGDAVVFEEYPFDSETGKHRPPMIQTFKQKATGENVTVVVNHLKSKGSSCEALADPEDDNLQGNCNRQRVSAAESLGKYLEANYAGENVLIIGDLNSYAKEDPILVLTQDDSGRAIEKSARENGYYSAVETDYHLGYVNLAGENSVTYTYDGELGSLDYALGSPAVVDNVLAAGTWSINAFEMRALDYNTEYKGSKDENGASWDDRMVVADSPFRSSDHDPVIVDLDLTIGSMDDLTLAWKLVLERNYTQEQLDSMTAYQLGKAKLSLSRQDVTRVATALELASQLGLDRMDYVKSVLDYPRYSHQRILINELHNNFNRRELRGIVSSIEADTVSAVQQSRWEIIEKVKELSRQ